MQGYFVTKVHFEGCTCPARVYILDNTCAPVIGQDLMTRLSMHLDCGTGQVHHTKEDKGSEEVELGSRGLSDAKTAIASSTAGHGDCSSVELWQRPFKTLPPVISNFIKHHPDLVSEGIGMFPGFEHCIKLAPEAGRKWEAGRGLHSLGTPCVRELSRGSNVQSLTSWSWPSMTPMQLHSSPLMPQGWGSLPF